MVIQETPRDTYSGGELSFETSTLKSCILLQFLQLPLSMIMGGWKCHYSNMQIFRFRKDFLPAHPEAGLQGPYRTQKGAQTNALWAYRTPTEPQGSLASADSGLRAMVFLPDPLLQKNGVWSQPHENRSLMIGWDKYKALCWHLSAVISLSC